MPEARDAVLVVGVAMRVVVVVVVAVVMIVIVIGVVVIGVVVIGVVVIGFVVIRMVVIRMVVIRNVDDRVAEVNVVGMVKRLVERRRENGAVAVEENRQRPQDDGARDRGRTGARRL
jgi:hypothetical protein